MSHSASAKELELHGHLIIAPVGHSMRPMLRPGKDTVYIVRADKPLKKLDVALYRDENGSSVLHRVVRVMQETYVLCGDNWDVGEDTVHSSQIIGVLQGFFRGNRYISCRNIFYKLYTWCWFGLRPARKLCREAGKIVKKNRGR